MIKSPINQIFLPIYLILLFSVCLLGQNNTYYEHGYKIEEYGVTEGIAGPEVAGILEDRQGYIWLASLNELIRYDGISFKSYPLDKATRLNNRRDYTWGLVEDNFGNIWMNAQVGRDLIRFNPKTEKFKRFSFSTDAFPQLVQTPSNQYLVAFEDKL